jgi:DNA helicase-2/ATP-dependent DNA helicase PcrA
MIVQIAAVEIIQGIIGKTFEVYLKTDKSLAETEHVHHITNEYLDLQGVSSVEALTGFKNFVNGNPLIAHNLNYDWEILKSNNSRQGIETTSQFSLVNFDTLEITRRLYPKQKSYKLEYLIETFKIEGVNSHNALDDVKATANLIQFLVPRVENLLKAQLLFAEEHERILLKFRSNLLSLWLDIQATFNNETTFRAVIDQFLSHSNLTVNYEIEPGSINQIEKLLVNMDSKCGSKPLKTLLQKDLPHYKTCKESDLITNNDKVVISTIHKAKGLEFDNVIIPECVNDIYPHFYSKTAEAITEDARLIYVGLTRSKKRLILTSHTISVNQWGKAFPRSRSRFLDPILHHFEHVIV